MPAITTRAKLPKQNGGEVVDVGTLNNAFDKIDGLLGAVPVLSTALPNAPFVGMIIHETDTNTFKMWDGTSWLWIGGKEGADSTHIFTTPVKSGWRVSTLRKRISDRALLFEGMAFPTASGGTLNANAAFLDIGEGWVSGTNDSDYPEWTRTTAVGSSFGGSFLVSGIISGAGANTDCHFSIGANGSVGIRVQANLTLNTSHRLYCPPVVLFRGN